VKGLFYFIGIKPQCKQIKNILKASCNLLIVDLQVINTLRDKKGKHEFI